MPQQAPTVVGMIVIDSLDERSSSAPLQQAASLVDTLERLANKQGPLPVAASERLRPEPLVMSRLSANLERLQADLKIETELLRNRIESDLR